MILFFSNEKDTSDKKHVKSLGCVFNLSSDIRAATISSRWVIWEYNQYHVPRQRYTLLSSTFVTLKYIRNYTLLEYIVYLS